MQEYCKKEGLKLYVAAHALVNRGYLAVHQRFSDVDMRMLLALSPYALQLIRSCMLVVLLMGIGTDAGSR
jgi:hypothetical protein